MGSNSYIPKLASADRISDEMKEKQIFYKLYAGVAFGRVDLFRILIMFCLLIIPSLLQRCL